MDWSMRRLLRMISLDVVKVIEVLVTVRRDVGSDAVCAVS